MRASRKSYLSMDNLDIEEENEEDEESDKYISDDDEDIESPQHTD